MPTYNYRCKACNQPHEASLPMSERNTCPACPACGEESKKILTPISFSFNEGDRPESSKPDSYWNNAESQKQKRQDAEQRKVMEQSFYNDPKCPDKYKDMTFSKKEK